jgi:hypothetical protein
MATIPLLAIGLFLFWPLSSQVTRENFERIRTGMSRAEVEAILGGPPGDYTTGPTEKDLLELSAADTPEGPRYLVIWEGDSGTIWVGFDANDRAIEHKLQPARRKEQGTLDSLLWRAGHRLRR